LETRDSQPGLAVEAEMAPAADLAMPESPATIAAPPNDSYLGIERRLRVPLQRWAGRLLDPLTALLSRVGVSANAVSAFQVLLTAGAFYALPRRPRASLLLWLAALASDGIDGMLARRVGRPSTFGMLWDHTCDHAREALLVAALAHYGLVRPLWATLYAFTYPAQNVTVYLSNHYAVPLALASRNYLTFYPALIAYLGWGINALTPALLLATTTMAAGCGVALWRLHRVMR
jgi:phosphatidylglycerophosphate synthase